MNEQHAQVLGRYATALDAFGRLVRQVAAEQWGAPTPCTDWAVREVVNHVTVEQLWVPAMMAGATVAEVGDRFDGDQLGTDPVGVWNAAAAEARRAFEEQGALDRTVHLSFADTSARSYCTQMIADLVVHSWDLAKGLGADARLADDLVVAALDEVTPYAPDLAASGLFAPPVAVPEAAGQQARLLGMTGRRADWQPPG